MKKKTQLFGIVFILLFSSKLFAQTTYYVNINATGSNNGTSWANAYTDLQSALDTATTNDQVWVAQGTYLPTESPDGVSTNTRNQAFHFNKDILLYGGFAGTEALLTDRTTGHETILSGDLNGDDNSGGDNSENAFHVLVTTALTSNTIIDGFTITKGNANGNLGASAITYNGENFFRYHGSGMYNILSSPTITNITFTNNSANSSGGGMFNSSSSPTITNTTFANNSADYGGGGMYNAFSLSPTITNTTFANNFSDNTGGGIYNVLSSPIINNTVFYNNIASGSINDVYNDSSTPTGNNNASDGTNAPNIAITLTTDPFTDSANPTGTDGVFGTTDDGLMPVCGSSLINTGDNSLYTGVLASDTDLGGSPRLFNTTIDIGAYERHPLNHIFVDITATTGLNDGTSWANAYTDLQTALNNVCDGDQVWVAQGTYLPTESPNAISTNTRDQAFHFNKDILLYGGFAGTEALLTDRTTGHETILSGDFNGDDNSGGDNSENAFHVLVTTALTNNTIIDGFTITKGNANGSGSIDYNGDDFFRYSGGGMYNILSSPTITHVTFTNNSADYGGGMFNYFSSPTITNITFTNNSANSNGGGMNNLYSTPTIINTTFANNSANSNGGGMDNLYSTPTITNTTFANNSANDNGGGMYNYDSTPTITNTSFANNSASFYGGGMDNYTTSSPNINNTSFTNNSAGMGGGGISTRNFSSPIINNTVFYNNTDNGSINDVYNDASTPTGNNNASDGTNAPNIAITLTTDPFTDSANPTGTDGIFGTTDDGLIPTACSPLINAGDNSLYTGVLALDTDLGGSPRLFNTIIDIGAYESHTLNHIFVDITATTGLNDGTNWANAYTDLQTALNNVCDGGQVWVAQGTYLPTESPDGVFTNTRDQAFHFNKDILLYGGFAGTEALLTDRTTGHETILSGDLNGDDNSGGDNSENAFHVLVTTTLTSNTIIDGFTITKGNANANFGTNPITYNGENFFRYHGSGMYNISSSPTITNTTFTNNSANYTGGGMYNSSSSPTITNTTFTNNSANSFGGGMYNASSSPTITNTTFANNSANENGGGMYNTSSSSPNINNTTFTNNSASFYGGGIDNFSGSSPIINNTTFTNNNADLGGAGISMDNISSVTINNTVFWNNTNNNGDINDVNNSLSTPTGNNNASDGTNAPNIAITLTTDPFTDSINPAGTDGIYGTADDGLIPACGSSLIDVGSNALYPGALATDTDLAGNPRAFNTTIDIGAYESQIADITDPVVDVTTLPDITAQCEVTTLTPPTATDNCAGAINGTTTTSLPIITQGTTVVTWTYDDGNGNTATQTQNVVINYNIAPIGDVNNELSYTLPTITGTNLTGSEKYYTQTNGTGTEYNAGDTIYYSDFTSYPITLYAFDSAGCNEESFELTLTQIPITITADANQSKVYGDTDPVLTYTITAGSLSGTDTLTGTLERTAGEDIGGYTINQGTLDNVNYDITFVADDFEIITRAITITADGNQTKIYGDTDPTLTYSITTGNLSGTDTLTGSLERFAGEDIGDYTINQGTLNNPNYDITFVADDFSIITRAITITADGNQSKVYGDTDPTLTYTVTPSLLGTDTLTGSLVRVTGENVGNYAINQSTLDNPNYDITFVSDDFEITQRAITITADANQSKVYGDTDPVLTYTITAGSLSGTDTLTGNLTRVTGETIGIYTINQGTLDNSNYDITYVGANFEITTTAQLALTCTTLNSPENGDTDVAVNTEISWNPVSDANGYLISILTNSSNNNITHFDNGNNTTYITSFNFDYNEQVTVLIIPYNSSGSATGCIEEVFTIESETLEETKYGFSPNGDGINDFWEIKGIENNPNNVVTIFNRWGDLVFTISNYNNQSKVFRGEANKLTKLGAGDLPDGTYFFHIKVSGTHHLQKLKGFVVIKR